VETGFMIASAALASMLSFAPWFQTPTKPTSPAPSSSATSSQGSPSSAASNPNQASPKPASTKPSGQDSSKSGDQPAFKQEELDQMLAPIALYPDSLLTQVLMASTYPLEVVQAERWGKANKDLKGDAKAKALEKQDWDPSVKSLTDFVPVLEMLSTKLDWTEKLGDAFIGQQAQVMETVQKLRAKAKENGKLESNKDQKVDVKSEGDKEYIVIESTSPSVIYVPTYDPVVVYGSWWYPSYPPYPYYPPGYVAGGMFLSFAVGVAWGYAWGNCNWGHGDVDIDINRNTEFNRNIDRSKYAKNTNRGSGAGAGNGKWKHDSAHRGSVPYRNSATAKQFGGTSAGQASQARAQYRGRAESGRAELNQGAADSFKGGGGANRATDTGRGAGSGRTEAGGNRGTEGRAGNSAGTSRGSSGTRASTGSRSGGLSGVGGGGSSARASSARGSASRGSRGGGGGGRGRR
jgi:hypothetical protein